MSVVTNVSSNQSLQNECRQNKCRQNKCLQNECHKNRLRFYKFKILPSYFVTGNATVKNCTRRENCDSRDW